jgi:hypothetical protein
VAPLFQLIVNDAGCGHARRSDFEELHEQ